MLKIGNVGIVGTDNPTEKLVVTGNANITGTLYKGTTVYTNPDVAERMPSSQKLYNGYAARCDDCKNSFGIAVTEQKKDDDKIVVLLK